MPLPVSITLKSVSGSCIAPTCSMSCSVALKPMPVIHAERFELSCFNKTIQLCRFQKPALPLLCCVLCMKPIFFKSPSTLSVVATVGS